MRKGSDAQTLVANGASSGGGDFGFGMGGGTYYSPDDDGAGGGGGTGDDDGSGGGSPQFTQADIDTAVTAATTGLKKNNTELLGHVAKLKEKHEGLSSQMAELKTAMGATGQTDLSGLANMLKKAGDDEEKALLQNGDIAGLKSRWLGVEQGNHKQAVDALKTEMGELQGSYDALVQNNRNLLIGGAIRKAAEKAGALPDAIDYLVSDGMKHFTLDGESIISKNADGTTRFGKDEKSEFTPDVFLEEAKDSKAFMFKGSAGGGSTGNQDKKLSGGKERYTLAAWQAKTSSATADERKVLIARQVAGEIVVA